MLPKEKINIQRLCERMMQYGNPPPLSSKYVVHCLLLSALPSGETSDQSQPYQRMNRKKKVHALFHNDFRKDVFYEAYYCAFPDISNCF